MFLVRHAWSGQQRKVPEVNHDLMGSGQILQVEQVHSQLEKITTSLRQCNFQSYMISVKTFFFFNNLKKKENFVGYSSNNHFISNIDMVVEAPALAKLQLVSVFASIPPAVSWPLSQPLCTLTYCQVRTSPC